MNLKFCTKCGEEKSIDEFRLKFYKSHGKYYHNSWCKKCEREEAKIYRKKNRASVLKYKEGYRKNHKCEISAYNKNYKKTNKEYINSLNRKWRYNHPECNKNYC